MPLYALSLKQPWAALLVSGPKTVEVRRWPARLRGRVLIHAARVPDRRKEAWLHVPDELHPLTRQRGGIIGAAELTDCVAYRTAETFAADRDRHLNDPSWFQPPQLYGFIFVAATEMLFRRLPGNVRFFRVPDEEAEA